MTNTRKLPRIRLYVGISTVFVLLTIVIVGSVVWNTYRETRLTALDNAEGLFEEVTTKVVERVRARFDSVSAVINAIASVPTLSQEPVRIDSLFREIHNLAASFASMKSSMYTFGRYVPKDLVRQILTAGGNAEVGGERRELTLLFSDVADFTTFSEEMDPEALMLHMSEYFEAMAEPIARHMGVIDKYIGDAVMAIWNAPRFDPDHVPHACAAVLECRLINEQMNADGSGARQRQNA